MADETTLRLRIEADATGLNASLNATEGQLRGFEAETKRVEAQLQQTAQAADAAGRQIVQMGEATHVSFGKLQAGMVAATVAGNALFEALDAVTRGLAAPITELLDAEQAAAMLQGTFGGLTAEMQQVATLASQLGANNAFFDDDALAQAGATLKLFGANATAIQELLPYVNDLAIAFGVDVNDAAQLVGQALMGQTRGLARMVPEVRGANSQLEVLAALQASAARNTDIARQRTEGLGGQLALLKRQAADAAQGFGTAMLPALNAVLRVINDTLLPVLGKMMAAFAGLSAFFGNLGKGLNLSDLTRVAGEAILNAEAQFNAVSARVEQRASKIAGQAGNLAMAGTFGGGGAAAAAASRAAAPAARGVIGTEMLGPAVPSQLRYEVFTEDPGARKEREDRQREEAAAAKRRLDAELAAKQAAQDAANKAFAEAMLNAADKAAVILGRAVSGQGLRAQDFISLGTMIGSAIFPAFAPLISILGTFAGTIASEAGKTATIETDREQLARLQRELQRPLGYGESDVMRARQGLLLQEKIVALQDEIARKERETAMKNMDAAQIQLDAARQQREATKAAARESIESTIDQYRSLADQTAKRFADYSQPLLTTNEQGQQMFGTFRALRKYSEEELIKLGERARQGIKTGDLSSLREQFSGLSDDLFRALIATLAQLPQAAGGLQPGGIQNGTSPDRPVYVFDVRPREGFGFAPESFFFRNRGAGTSRAVAGNPLPVAQPAPVSPRVAPGTGRRAAG